MGIRNLLTVIGFAFFLAAPVFAAENALLARITVYWPGEGQVRACSNGARLRAGHCAVDPKKIPYGSRVLFPDAICVAIDSGPAVVNRLAARACGRTAAQRDAIVIDRFFETKQAAMDWERTHPHFMTVKVMEPGSAHAIEETVVTADGSEAPIRTAPKLSVPGRSLPKFDSARLRLGLPLDSVLQSNNRRT